MTATVSFAIAIAGFAGSCAAAICDIVGRSAMTTGYPGLERHMTRAACLAFAALAVLLLATAAARADGDGGLVEKFVKIMERIGSDADANKPDCEKIGTALSKHQVEDAATMRQVKENEAKLTAPERKAVRDLIKAKYGERLKASEAKAAPIKACTTNAKIKAYANQVMR